MNIFKVFTSTIKQNRYAYYIMCKCSSRASFVDPAISNSDTTNDHHALKNMKNYFKKHGLTEIFNQAPESYSKRVSIVDYFTLINPILAKKIAYAVCSRIDGGLVIESDPGFGFISQILAPVFPRLCLCERNLDFRFKLMKLKKINEDVRIWDFNVATLLKMMFVIQGVSLEKVTNFNEYIFQEKKLVDPFVINWIFSITHIKFMRLLCKLHLCDTSFQQLGKMEYYVTMPSQLHKVLTDSLRNLTQHTAFTATLFQIFFNNEILLNNIDRKMYLPWPSIKNDTNEKLLLIHFSLKENILNVFDSHQSIESFLKFLQIGLRKNRRVIPVLESYINNCGPIFLVNHGLTVYTEFLELNPEELISIFLSFSKLPEFSHFTFIDVAIDDLSQEEEISEKNFDSQNQNERNQ